MAVSGFCSKGMMVVKVSFLHILKSNSSKHLQYLYIALNPSSVKLPFTVPLKSKQTKSFPMCCKICKIQKLS